MMMAWIERTLDIKGNAVGDQLARVVTSADPDVSAEASPVSGSGLAENAQFLADEVNSLRRDQAKLQQAIFEAAQIQRKLCAPRELNWGEFEIAGEIFPVRHLSGDFFKVMELKAGLGLVLGDIAGKGLSAGIWQAHMMGLLQRSARRHSDPADVVAEVNLELCEDDGAPPIMALFFARIGPKNNLVYCNAGLPAPLLLRGNKRLERLEEGGPMLGALKTAVFQTGSVKLNPGDMLVAYSDGVTECRNTQDEEFEMERLAGAARSVSGVTASKALFSLLGTVLDFAETCSLADDLTLLVIRRRDGIKSEQARLRTKEFPVPQRGRTSASRPKNPEGGGHHPK